VFLFYWDAEGVPQYQQVEVDMFRMAALYVCERLKPQIMAYLDAVISTNLPKTVPKEAAGQSKSKYGP
jgi:hypothetical protein